MLMAGATLVGIGSAVINDGPSVFGRICTELANFMEDNGYAQLADVRGKALT
jgi:dihydroorotate dehydrogenase (fumarate)